MNESELAFFSVQLNLEMEFSSFTVNFHWISLDSLSLTSNVHHPPSHMQTTANHSLSADVGELL